ncbi:hypothetical protein A3K24_01295 [candidate division Kazan bacterium RIFCSPHIGHO2_01_FULL_44_14]|uniref:Peptide chain release factor N(5)-glutamine methyltransferase n=1 Tax=candidate division Kazan bacterium RIFCSPLOWO2_01_FULL_45_19 TaxID=1798538 RepID=A0A1F4NQB7_UNCK3|nr:hypothetical protein [uncultured bacterium]OGB73478.1 MAG: hypothetical protein A3K51_01295 [candidate division Kazan bacterium RIFCSPLOWO2_01_FULL_45_19]OGB77723.1 MAG: hypothetical protein A3K24_01295 [candidate division Kazan bacterium RIFCSPHIGHO2_01_FULL_44_14]
MKIKTALNWATKQLPASSTPRLDAEVLLAHILGVSKTDLYINSEQRLSPIVEVRYRWLIARRHSGVPVAYLTGQKEFFGLNFIVNRQVLIPRPETETIVRRTIELIERHNLSVVHEVGTGSGNIAVALTKNLPTLRVVASDISETALKVARRNAIQYGVDDRIEFICANLGEHIPSVDLVVANLPYVPTDYYPTREVFHEPSMAVFVPDDGLGLYRQFFLNTKFRFAVVELGPWQMDILVPWLKTNFPGTTIAPVKDDSGYVCGLEITKKVMSNE